MTQLGAQRLRIYAARDSAPTRDETRDPLARAPVQ